MLNKAGMCNRVAIKMRTAEASDRQLKAEVRKAMAKDRRPDSFERAYERPYGTILHIRVGEMNMWDFIPRDGHGQRALKRASKMAEAEMERIAQAESEVLKETRRRK